MLENSEEVKPDPTSTDMYAVSPDKDAEAQTQESVKAQVQKIIKTIKGDITFHGTAFKRMRDDMYVARHGRRKEWKADNYVANLTGRFVKLKTASLYAKNPKATARRRETIDFTVWDENPDTLKLAIGTTTQANAAAETAPPAVDPVTGQQMPPPPPSPELQQAQAVMADYQQGLQRRTMLTKVGKTLELLFSYATTEQKPLDFKTGMKKVVRRACTVGVGYVEIGFQRTTGPRAGLTEQLADARQRLDHMQALIKEQSEGEIDPDSAERYELEAMIASLQAEPEIVLREGLIFDYPAATHVIPDRLCKSIVGFVGSRHVTVEYHFTVDQVEEMFGINLDGKYQSFRREADQSEYSENKVRDDDGQMYLEDVRGKGLVRVWKHYDKISGLVYYVADGYFGFLREPAAPDVFVDDFWPLYAITFNDVEDEDEVFPPSDVHLLLSMQEEYNRSRQGMREHRRAARPRWGAPKGQIDAEDMDTLKQADAFTVVLLNALAAGQKIGDILQVIPVPGVDPNLYETGPIFTDTQLVVGAQEAQFGGTSKATATESAIAANSSASGDGSSVDDLDSFLSRIARAAGQILMREMSPEQVIEQAGPGALWPQMSMTEIAKSLFLDVAAGSTGKPNQAADINNFKILAPLLLQIPGINKNWLAKEAISRLDDNADLTEALAESVPSIVAQNQMQQPATGNPQSDPNMQGPQGGQQVGGPPQQPGSDPAFGSNQVQHGGL